MYALNKNGTYFDSFGVKYIPKEIKKSIDKSTVITNIFRIQACDSVMYGYFCIRFINSMIAGNTLTDFINLLSTNNFKNNDDIILNCFITNV